MLGAQWFAGCFEVLGARQTLAKNKRPRTVACPGPWDVTGLLRCRQLRAGHQRGRYAPT